MTNILLLVVGTVVFVLLVAVAGAALVGHARRRAGDTDSASALDELRRGLAEERAALEARQDAVMAAALDQLVTTNQALLGDGRSEAREELDSKKELIDAQLAGVNERMTQIGDLVTRLERDREAKFGALTEQLALQQEGIAGLNQTTQGLREALSSTKARGQWGERMAEDVLRLAGFVRDVNYRHNRAIETGGLPDFTFFMPQELFLHMDVKFPLDNYLRYLECQSELDAHRCRDAFLRDVRAHVKTLAARGYADGDDTVDYVLMFIPNEALYAFVHEHDSAILDDALARGIVMCSPLTLFAVLAVVRQSIESFQVERTAQEILKLLCDLDKQWDKYVDRMGKLGRTLDTARRDFDELIGTRQRGVERVLRKVDALRAHQPALSEAEGGGGDADADGAPRALEA